MRVIFFSDLTSYFVGRVKTVPSPFTGLLPISGTAWYILVQFGGLVPLTALLQNADTAHHYTKTAGVSPLQVTPQPPVPCSSVRRGNCGPLPLDGNPILGSYGIVVRGKFP